MASQSWHSQLLTLLTSLNSEDIRAPQFSVLRGTLDDLSRELVSNKALRIQLGSQHPSIWALLHELWDNLAITQSAGSNSDPQLVIGLARFTRNLIADVPFNQKNAFPLEPRIRQLIYLHTAWTKDSTESTLATTRMLTQTLSNLVTGNQELLDQFWAIHMQIPEEQSVLIRLLSLPDLRLVISVLVLIMNCIHDSSERGHALVNTNIGVRVCVSILDRLQALLDHSESGDEGKVFELGYALFSKLFQFGFFPELYNRRSMQDEPVSPTQTTLLKLLDSFLQPVPLFQGGVNDPRKLAGCLVSAFFSQAEYMQRAVQQAIAVSPPDQDHPTSVLGIGEIPQQAVGNALDLRFPGVCVALVLLSTCLSSVLLAEREKRENEGGASTDPNLVMLTLPCHDTITGSGNSTATGFIEVLIETLRLLDIFLPRINFGKVRTSNVRDGAVIPGQSADVTGFAYLKRDLVRLLGILCHNNQAIQDRVRRCGGIPIVLNLCVIDERNPYLREHALFTLRNLLHNNPENQAVVDTFKADKHVGTVMYSSGS